MSQIHDRIPLAFYATLFAVGFLALGLTGCSGEPDATVASAPAAAPPSTPPAANQAESEPDEEEEPASQGYGSEEFSAAQPSRSGQGGGGGYGDYGADGSGGGMYGDYGADGSGMYGEGDMGYGEGDMGYGGGEGSDGMYGGGGGPNFGSAGVGGSDDMGYGGSDDMGYGAGGMYGEGDMGYGEGGMYGGGDMYAGGGYGGGMYGAGGGAGGNADPAAGMAIQFIRQNCGNCHGQRQPKGGVRLDVLTANFEDYANVQLWSSAIEQLETGAMPPAGQQRRPDPQQSQAVIDFVRRAMQESGLDSEDYLAEAKHAFGTGNEEKAMDLLFAHLLTTDDETAQEMLAQTGWYAGGPRPATTLRFAAGIVLKAPTTLTDVKPIGSGALGGGSGGGDGYGGMGMGMPGGGGAGQGQAAGPRSFDALTGDFGASLAAEFQSRWANGDMGSIFNEVVSITPSRRPAGGMGGMGMGMGGGGPGGPALMGEDGGYGGSDMSGYGEGGDPYGDGSQGYGGAGYGGAGGDAGESHLASLRENILPGQAITPGLIYVGVGSQAELMERAAMHDVDGVFVFNIDVTENRRMGIVQNKTRLRLVLANGKAVGATSTLLNTEVERKRARTGEDDLQENMDRFFASIGDSLKLSPMPALQPQHAVSRVKQLLTQREKLPEEEEPSMDLKIMFETRLFHSKGLLTEEEAAMVYQILLKGNEGVVLVQGKPDDRRLVLEEMLAQSE